MYEYKNLINKYDFETGDLLLFSHNDNCSNLCNSLFTFFTDCIKCCTKSPWSHSAIIVKNPSWRKDLKGYYVLQSSYETFPDAEDQELKLGVELVSMQKLFENYNGKIYCRFIKCNRDQIFYDNLEKAHSVVHNRPYDINPYDWYRAAYKIYKGPTHRLKTFWCAALVSYIYVQLGLFEKQTPWTLISPYDLSSESKYPKFNKCYISNEIRLK